MVHDAQDHEFRKLRINTHHPVRGASDNPFAYNVRTNSAQLEAQQSYGSYTSQTEPQQGHGSYNAQVSSELSSSDLLETLNQAEQQLFGSQASKTNKRHEGGRERGTSISFSSHATLDDGVQHSIGEPLPKHGSVRRRNRGASVTGDSQGGAITPDTPTSGESPRINPFTGEPIRRRVRRTDTFPRLDRIESVQAASIPVPALTSDNAASPPNEAIQTPLSTSMNGSMLLSPNPITSPGHSPIIGSEPWPMTSRDSMMSRVCSSSRQASLRNSSRRSSRMSASSPASAFLGMWGKDSAASIAPDPDEEGQTIGLNNEYVIGRQVGYGGFSVVKELHGIADDGRKIRRTVKIVRKTIPDVSESMNDKQQQAIEHEVDVWRYLQNEYILSLHAVYDTEFATFCVMDYVEGGTLFDLVRKFRRSGTRGLGVKLAKHYAHQLACALRYLHEDIRLVHRDVKLENCLLDMSAPDAGTKGGRLQLCDFGLADFITNGDMYDSIDLLDLNDSGMEIATDIVGTLQYACPEAFATGKHALRPAVDMWAFGVCLYTMITGTLPFKHSLQSRVTQMIISGRWDREAVRSAVDSHPDCENIIDVLDGCLEIDSSLRWTISDLMDCAWFMDLKHENGRDDWQMLS